MGDFTLGRFLTPFLSDQEGRRMGETVTGHHGRAAD